MRDLFRSLSNDLLWPSGDGLLLLLMLLSTDLLDARRSIGSAAAGGSGDLDLFLEYALYPSVSTLLDAGRPAGIGSSLMTRTGERDL